MASRKRRKTSRKRSKKGLRKKDSANPKLVVFVFVMAVVGFAIWHNSSTVPPRPQEPTQIAQPLRPSLPLKPRETVKPQKPTLAVTPLKPMKPVLAPKPVPAPKPAEAVKPVPAPKPMEAAKPAEPSKPAEIAKPVKPLKPRAPAKPSGPARPSGFFSFFFRPADLDSKAAGTFKKYGLTKATLVRRLSIEKQTGDTKYFRTYAEYEVPASFAWREFQPALSKTLKGSPFRVNAVGRRALTGYDIYYLSINRDDLTIMRLEIRRKKAVPSATVVLPRKGPRVAIVIDDFGYTMNNVETFLGIGQPLTLAILPRQPYSAEIARIARSRGYEAILHLPLEAMGPEVKAETDTVRVGMDESDIVIQLKKDLADVPGARGVSNHQGSKATADKPVMTAVSRYLKKGGLYFFDSLTTAQSVCREAASEAGIKYARRDKFLDNDNDPAAIEKQIAELKTVAAARGRAIAICHDRKNSAAVLARMMPEMAKEGIVFVYLSDMEQ